MYRLNLQLQPRTDITVPNSDGYNVFSGLLALLEDYDPSLSKRIHDSNIAEFHSSGLIGEFGRSDKHHHKTIQQDVTYRLVIGIPTDDDELFTAFAEQFQDGPALTVSGGDLEVVSVDTSETTPEEILRNARRAHDPDLRFNFQSPICIEEAPDITTLFPHRVPVFTDLASKWNRYVDDEHEISLSEESVKSSVVEQSKGHIPSFNVVVDRFTGQNGEPQNIFSHGFGGGVTYGFRDAPRAVERKVTALSLFAEYCGIGIATARGCGNVKITVQ